MSSRKGSIAVIGAGPGGMATALAAHMRGFEVKLFERWIAAGASSVQPASTLQ